ncbi:hypothetical protein DVQ80_02435 [Yersinia enterocolitica]|nr:hypothetical protein [Yersinia enterocolitica]
MHLFILPPFRALLPRRLRATFASFFVHWQIEVKSAQILGGKGIKSIKKIVQICALLCKYYSR